MASMGEALTMLEVRSLGWRGQGRVELSGRIEDEAIPNRQAGAPFTLIYLSMPTVWTQLFAEDRRHFAQGPFQLVFCSPERLVSNINHKEAFFWHQAEHQ
jgi:hypothetical protein